MLWSVENVAIISQSSGSQWNGNWSEKWRKMHLHSMSENASIISFISSILCARYWTPLILPSMYRVHGGHPYSTNDRSVCSSLISFGLSISLELR